MWRQTEELAVVYLDWKTGPGLIAAISMGLMSLLSEGKQTQSKVAPGNLF